MPTIDLYLKLIESATLWMVLNERARWFPCIPTFNNTGHPQLTSKGINAEVQPAWTEDPK